MKATTSPVSAAKNVEKQLRAKLRAVSKEGKALKRAEEQMSAAFRQCPVALCIVDMPEGRVLDANQRMSQLTGYAVEELAGQSVGLLVPAEAPSPFEQFRSATRESAASLEMSVPIKTKDGAERHAVWSLRSLTGGGAPCAVIAFTEPGDWAQKEYDLNRQAASLNEQIALLQSENADHLDQKERLVRQVGELVDQAAQLKMDAIKLRQMQHELTDELKRLKEHAGLLIPMQPPAQAPAPLSSTAEPNGEEPEPAPAAESPAAAASDASNATRTAAPSDQLARHMAALREMAQRIESEIGTTRTAA